MAGRSKALVALPAPHVACRWNKGDVGGLYVQVLDALPSGKSSSRHASFRWLDEP